MFAELDHRDAPARALVVGRTASRFRATRFGATLIELLVVLAILVVIAGMVAIPIASVMETQALTQGADILRARLSQTRVEAMRTGKIHLLEYAPETNQFGVSVWEGEVLEGESMSPDGLVAGTARKIYLGGGSLDGDKAMFGAATEFLPQEVRFVGGQTMADERTLGTAEASGTGKSASKPGGAAPIYFYPDGTTSKSSIVLGNSQGSALVVTMRGLTGLAKVSEMQTTHGAMP